MERLSTIDFLDSVYKPEVDDEFECAVQDNLAPFVKAERFKEFRLSVTCVKDPKKSFEITMMNFPLMVHPAFMGEAYDIIQEPFMVSWDDDGRSILPQDMMMIPTEEALWKHFDKVLSHLYTPPLVSCKHMVWPIYADETDTWFSGTGVPEKKQKWRVQSVYSVDDNPL